MTEVIDVEHLTRADRAAYTRMLKAEEARLAAEVAEDQRRSDERRAAEIIDDIDTAQRSRRETAARIAERARNRSDGAMAKVATHLDRAASRELSRTESVAEEQLARSAYQRSQEWQGLADKLTVSAKVHEPDIYSPVSPHSYYADVIACAGHGNPMDPGATTEARKRLEAYGRDIANDWGKPGMRARSVWRNASRKAADLRSATDRETRALSSGSASAGALVTPDYLTSQYALWRSFAPAVADACNNTVDLPSYGLEVEIPRDLSGAPVSIQSSENSGGATADFTSTLATAPIETFFGYSTVSQQLYDRSGPGVKADQFVGAQLQASLDAAVDTAVINALIAAATTNLTRSSWTDMSSLWSDVNNAASSLALLIRVDCEVDLSTLT